MKPPLSEMNPFDPALLSDPFDYYARLRAEAPVHRDPATGFVIVSTYERVDEVIRQPAVYSNKFGPAIQGRGDPPPEVVAIQEQGWPAMDTMLTADPPEHRRFRRLVEKGFSRSRVRNFEPRIRELAGELIDRFIDLGEVELIAQFANPLPLTVIAEQLGVPNEDLPRFRAWSEGFVAQLSQMSNLDEEVAAAKMVLAFQRYFARALEARREDPKDDILSDLVHARIEDEKPLDMAESLSIIQQLLVAGNETTTSAIAGGVLLLIQHPDQLALVREDSSHIPNLVEEVLRYTTPTSNMWRVAAQDSILGGVEIAKGSVLLLRYASANRDEKVFDDPTRFDVTRKNASDHLAFGRGTHFCLGANLARMEMQVAFELLLDRWKSFRLAPEKNDLFYKPNILLRGLSELHLEFDAS